MKRLARSLALGRPGATRLSLSMAAVAIVLVAIPGMAEAGLILNTGINTTPGGGGEGATDNLWRAAYVYPVGTSNDVSTITVTGNQFPIGPWIADTADSGWIAPSTTGRNNAPPVAADPTINYTYYTTFNLSAADAALNNSVLTTGRWSSDNNGIEIDLNGSAVWTGNTGDKAYTGWHDYSFTGGFQQGVNTLAFVVANIPQNTGNPTGFRLEGSILTTAVPEPSSLLMGAVGAGLFTLSGIVSRRRRAA